MVSEELEQAERTKTAANGRNSFRNNMEIPLIFPHTIFFANGIKYHSDDVAHDVRRNRRRRNAALEMAMVSGQ